MVVEISLRFCHDGFLSVFNCHLNPSFEKLSAGITVEDTDNSDEVYFPEKNLGPN